jgi:hypothetical protein
LVSHVAGRWGTFNGLLDQKWRKDEGKEVLSEVLHHDFIVVVFMTITFQKEKKN